MPGDSTPNKQGLVPNKHTKKCLKCSVFIPQWQVHDLCHKHKRPCHSRNTCKQCKHWSPSDWNLSEQHDQMIKTPKSKRAPTPVSVPRTKTKDHGQSVGSTEDRSITVDQSQERLGPKPKSSKCSNVRPPLLHLESLGKEIKNDGPSHSPSNSEAKELARIRDKVTPSMPEVLEQIRLDSRRDLQQMKARDKKKSKRSRVETTVTQESQPQALDKSDLLNMLQQLGFSIPSQNKVDICDGEDTSCIITNPCTSPFQPTFNVERPEKAAEQAGCLHSPSDGRGNPLEYGMINIPANAPISALSRHSDQSVEGGFIDNPRRAVVPGDQLANPSFASLSDDRRTGEMSQKMPQARGKPRREVGENPRSDRITADGRCDFEIREKEDRNVSQGNYPQKRQWHDVGQGEYECDTFHTSNDVETSENLKKSRFIPEHLPDCQMPQEVDSRHIVKCGKNTDPKIRTDQYDNPTMDSCDSAEEDDPMWETYYIKEKGLNGEYQFVEKRRYKDIQPRKNTQSSLDNLHTKADSSDENISVVEENRKMDDEQVNFMGRLKTVWKIMEDQLPDSSEGKKKSIQSKSLLSSKREEKEEFQWLPMGELVRSSVAYWTETGKNLDEGKNAFQMSKSKSNMYGKFPTNAKFINRHGKWYRTCSEDFSMDPPVLSNKMKQLLSGKETATIFLTEQVSRAMEKWTRTGLAAANTKDWLLGTIKTIMDQLLLEMQNDQPSVEKITEGLTACTELLQSVGKASETEVSALAYNLYVLSLSRRDSILKSIKVSNSLKEEMRHAPLMWEQHNIKCSEEDEPQYMFRGLCSKIEQDRKKEVEVAMQDLLLKSATSGKSFKYPASRSLHYQQEPRRKPYDTKKREKPRVFSTKSNSPEKKSDNFRPYNQSTYENQPQRGRGGRVRGFFRGNRGSSRGFRGSAAPKYFK